MFTVLSQDNIVFLQHNGRQSIPINNVDSIKTQGTRQFNVYMIGQQTPYVVAADTALYLLTLPDTLFIQFNEGGVYFQNPHMDWIRVNVQGSIVNVLTTGKEPLICEVSGTCSNGRLIVECDTTSTIVLNGLSLVSQEGSAIYLKEKQETVIEVKAGTTNTLKDADTYQNLDATDKSNACIYARGSLTFEGTGQLAVQGNYRNAISSNKNITVNDGDIRILNTSKDGIHCDKYRHNGGTVDLHLSNPATKGIKAKELIELIGGLISGEALGDLTITDGETTYCTLLKSDSTCHLLGGTIDLKHHGDGGRCVSVDADLIVNGARLNLECQGNGGGYINALNDSDYYSPKCITANGNVRILRGQINLLSTGIGGKGLDCSDTIFVGKKGEDFISEDSLLIKIETRGNAVVENSVEDYLHGCPKAMKADSDIELYSGTLRIKTHGSGGEGIESKESLRVYNATIIADCYDDGINTNQRCYIKGGLIYCRSINNDGIDSNGKLSVSGGFVASISEHFMNESFDTEGGRMYIYGGNVFGISRNEVYVSEQSTVPYYSTKTKFNEWGLRYGDSIRIAKNHYLTISLNQDAVMSFFHEVSFDDAFVIVASPSFMQGEVYQISDGLPPSNPNETLLDNQVILGGQIDESEILYNFKP